MLTEIELKNINTWRVLLPHIQKLCTSDLLQKDIKCNQLLALASAKCFLSDGRPREAELQPMTFSRILSEPNIADMFTNINFRVALADANLGQRKIEQAEELNRQALQMSLSTYGQDDHGTLSIISQLAKIRQRQNNFTSAEALYLQILKSKRTNLVDEDGRDVMSIKYALAKIAMKQGRHKEAEELVLQTQPKVLSDESLYLSGIVYSAAVLLLLQRKYQEGEEFLSKVLTKMTKILGKRHLQTMPVMYGFGVFAQIRGRYEDAEELFLRAPPFMEEAVGEVSYIILHTKFILAKNLELRRRWIDAEAMYLEVLATAKSSRLGEEDYFKWKVTGVVALFYKEHKRFDKYNDLARSIRDDAPQEFLDTRFPNELWDEIDLTESLGETPRTSTVPGPLELASVASTTTT